MVAQGVQLYPLTYYVVWEESRRTLRHMHEVGMVRSSSLDYRKFLMLRKVSTSAYEVIARSYRYFGLCRATIRSKKSSEV